MHPILTRLSFGWLLFFGALAGCGGGTQPAAPVALATATPTPSPSPGPVDVSPASVQFPAAQETALLSASEPAYAGTFSATSNDANVATVSPANGTAFTVTGIAVGSTTIAITDLMGRTTNVPVSVASTTVTGS